MTALAVGGTDDHVHMLLSLPSSAPVAKAMREIKSASSRWMHETCRINGFEWQEGYGAFSVGTSQITPRQPTSPTSRSIIRSEISRENS